jgi:hypothetical protein
LSTIEWAIARVVDSAPATENSREGTPMGNYDEMYRRSIEDPEGFWGEAAESLVWEKKWDRAGG